MNCANHPEIPVSAYCQFCGKPLCKDCVRSIGGVVYCESCLQARMGAPAAGGPGVGVPLQPISGPHPALAGLLGVIPGVGAMYNGQLVKGIAHVIIFAILVSLSHASGVFGILIPAWVFYQVFDAYQTAKARRDGLPLPDPFGLNDLGSRLGLHPNSNASPFVAGAPPQAPPAPPYAGGAPAAGNPAEAPAAGFVPPAAPYTAAPHEAFHGAYASAPGGPAYQYEPVVPSSFRASNVPAGAVVLIALGVLFLLGTLGVLNGAWVERGWPLVIIGLGVWLFIRRSQEIKAREAQSAEKEVGTGGLR